MRPEIHRPSPSTAGREQFLRARDDAREDDGAGGYEADLPFFEHEFGAVAGREGDGCAGGPGDGAREEETEGYLREHVECPFSLLDDRIFGYAGEHEQMAEFVVVVTFIWGGREEEADFAQAGSSVLLDVFENELVGVVFVLDAAFVFVGAEFVELDVHFVGAGDEVPVAEDEFAFEFVAAGCVQDELEGGVPGFVGPFAVGYCALSWKSD